MMLNCCMFNVIFLRNKNTIVFLNIIIRKEVYFHNLQVAHKLIMTMQIEQCNASKIYTSRSCQYVPLFGALLHPKKQWFLS